jgi:hypothetical protein
MGFVDVCREKISVLNMLLNVAAQSLLILIKMFLFYIHILICMQLYINAENLKI